MDKLKFIINLIKTIIYTGYVRITKGAPFPSWDFKSHLIYNLFKGGSGPRPGQSLEKIRKFNDISIFPPPKDFNITKTYIPDHYRELSHGIVKEVLIKGIGKYPIERENAFWYNSEKLELELAVSKSVDLNVNKETLLYLHGGAYIQGSVNTHRPLFCKLGEKASCQVAALSYRLAPEYPFPCALEDTLAAYLYLTSQETAEHPGIGIDASKIVIAGDSAGGGLASSFLILLSQLEEYKMVAGGLLLSPWVDLASSQPSILTKNNDFLEGPIESKEGKGYLFMDRLLMNAPENLKEEIVNNGHFYIHEKYLRYPLVSPMYQDNFDKFPPIMITVGGEERFEDEVIIFAHKIKNYNQSRPNSSSITLHIYDEMIHVFQALESHPSSQKSFELSSKFIKDCFNNNNKDVNGLWAYKVDVKQTFNPVEYDTSKYNITKPFSLSGEA